MEITKLLLKIISINTENPPGEEIALSNFLIKTLKNEGFSILKQTIAKNRNNIIAYVGKPEQILIAFNAHLDTVPVGIITNWEKPPFGKYKNGRIYGRGACDVKGSIAALIESAIKSKKAGHINFALIFTADEESGNFLGVKKISKEIGNIFPNLKLIIVSEPTDLKIGVAHKGAVAMTIYFKGNQAHGSTPELGENAINSAINAIEKISKYQARRMTISNPLLGKPTINIGKIYGGTKVNIVPDNCNLEMETRILPEENAEKIIDKIKKIAKFYKGNLEIICSLPPFFQENNRNVKKITKIVRKINSNTGLIGLNYYTEAEIYKRESKIDCLIFGAGNQNLMHASDEFIKVKDLLLAEKIYFEIIRNFS